MSKVVTLQKGWHLREREPAKRDRKLILVNPSQMDVLKDAPKLMSTAQAGEVMGFSAYSMAEWCRTGVIEAFKVRGEWRIPRESLAKFLLQGK
jgi:excisionase family DNA binding protein